MSVLLTERSWPQIKDAVEAGAVVVVPIGATEQHGHHLPLEVDWRLCETVAESACKKVTDRGVSALVTPAIWTGFSPHHMDFPGTVTLSSGTFTSLVRDVAKSLWQHGFQKILLLNGHGGNANLLRAAVQQLRFEDGVRAATASYWDFALQYIQEWRQSPPGGINHACEMETSLMLAVREELVDMEKARDALRPPRSKFLGGDLATGSAVTVSSSFAELSYDGIIGASTKGDGHRGRQLLDAVVDAVAEFLGEFHGWDWDEARQI